MIVIIAEKPSLARNIINALGKFNKKDGYYINNEYIVTYAFGHLFTLYDIEDYTNEIVKWKIDNLPYYPEKFKFNLKKDNKTKEIDLGVKKQFDIIKNLINREDVTKIVNAGDADREGEIIIRLIINEALDKNSNKEIYRLWLKDQTDETINKAIKEMKKDDEYNNLANEGLSRTYIDWLYGVNLTRYATLKTGVLLRVGRVIVPIVKAIYDRDKSIENFTPEIYYGICSTAKTNDEVIELNSKEKFSKDELGKAKKLCDEYNLLKAEVKSKKIKNDILKPPKLFSLSKLQNVLGKKYKMPMKESLQIIQKLYEEGYLTYPRTNSEYLATNEKDKIKKIIDIFKQKGNDIVFKDKKTIFDDSKIESHSALTPTYKIPDKDKLKEKELLIYKTVLKRFMAVFCNEECKIEKTEITIKLGDKEEFVLKGNVIVTKGFTKYENDRNDKVLPKLEKGDIINIDFKPKEKKNTAPKHYTIETLNNYLKNPFREDKKNKEDDDDYEEYKAIFEGLELGTEATRTGIIENAINSKYISLKKDVYYLEPLGEYLIESLTNMNIVMDKYKTSELGKGLKKVYRNEFTIDDVVNEAKNEINDVFNYEKTNIDKNIGFYMDKVGICPKCGKDVVRNRYGYGCLGYKNGCDFKINLTICKRIISKDNAIKLLKDKKTDVIENFISKNDKPFSARLKLEDNNIVFDFN